jgi:DNA/RNA endonuclease YhcR with UshA esterase domain
MLWKSSVFAFAMLPSAIALAAEPTVIKPEEAKANVDKEVIVEYTVNSASILDDKNVGFLNSEGNNRDEKNFTAFITPKGMRAFKDERKIANPGAEFVSKKIRVKGKIKLFKNKLEIEVDHPDQIEVVKEE